MSSTIFPSFAGQGWDIERIPVWDTTIQENSSGKEVRIPNQTYPRYIWNLTFDVLRQGVVHGTAYAEFSQLLGFYNARQGQFDSFLYTDEDDNSVTSQVIGVGDGSTTSFQLVRTFGGFVEPVLAPNVVSAIKLNGVTQSGGSYSVTGWGTSTPGVLTFVTAPGVGVSITADFSYYWPCRFDGDTLPFNKFMSSLYAGKKLSFKSLKN